MSDPQDLHRQPEQSRLWRQKPVTETPKEINVEWNDVASQAMTIAKIGLKTLLYLSLILLCFLFSPDVPVQFIYTEF